MNVGMSLVGFSDVWVLEFINKSIELFPACSDTYPLHIGVSGSSADGSSAILQLKSQLYASDAHLAISKKLACLKI